MIYVTRTGHARTLAERVAKRSGTEALEIVDLVNRQGILGFLKAGMEASKKLATDIRDPNVMLDSAAQVILVQPVWAGAVCPPLRTWIQAHLTELEGKRIGLLCTNKGSPGEPVRAKYEKEFGPLSSFAVIRENLTDDEKEAIISNFLGQLEKG